VAGGESGPGSREGAITVAIHPQAGTTTLSPGTARALVRVVRLIYPHRRFPDGPYERVVQKLDADASQDAAVAGTLEQGVRDLDAAAGRPFVDLDEAEARRVLEAAGATPFFATVRATAVVALYDQAEVWELLGYEGPSFDQGGYLRRGFDDLDWLPAPPT
jgi:hypothetical protein